MQRLLFDWCASDEARWNFVQRRSEETAIEHQSEEGNVEELDRGAKQD
jgi:hypothetical protein